MNPLRRPALTLVRLAFRAILLRLWRTRNLIVLLVLLTPTSCSPAAPSYTPCYYTRDTGQVWTDDPRLAPHVRKGLQRWSHATGRPWVFRPGPRVVRFAPTPRSDFIGYHDGTCIHLRPTGWDSDLHVEQVVLHELGHYYTHTHATHKGSVLWPTDAGGRFITDVDVETVCSDYPCSQRMPEVYSVPLGPTSNAEVGSSLP